MSTRVQCRLPTSRLNTSFVAPRTLLRRALVPAVQRKAVQPQAFFGGGNKAASSSQFYICIDCGYIYDNSAGPWAEIPSFFRCPACNSPKARFKIYKGDDVKGKPNNAKATMQKRMKEKKW